MSAVVRSMLATCLALAACAAKDGKHTQPPPSRPVLTDERIADLTSLAIGDTLDENKRAATIERLRSGSLTIDKYIDELLRDPRFSREIVPHMMLGYLDFGPSSFAMTALKQQPVDGVTVYFARKPCTLTETAEVAPWWDLQHPIKICAADYQPTVLKTKDGGVCSKTAALALHPECGCGPNLISCVADDAKKAEVHRSFHQESVRTISHVVENDLPLADVFTSNNSFRDRNVAYLSDVRDRIYQGAITQVPDLATWPVDGKWAPREEAWPGEHAGILTSRQLLYMSDGPRDRMRLFYDRAWCKAPTSFGVDIEVFRKLVHGAADLRNKTARWEQLAAQPGCTTCHARMDYGMQFFGGYQSVFSSVTATPETSRHRETGPFYGNDIGDKRGEATLTPHAFAEMLVAQDEFSDCMVEHVERHVLGVATLEERSELRRVFRSTHQLRPLFALALRQFVARPQAHRADTARLVPAALSSPRPPVTVDARIPVSKKLIAIVEDACQHCHQGDDPRLAFFANLGTTRTLDRDRLEAMANLVAFGLMPKDEVIPEAQRRALLEEIVGALAPDPAWAKTALGYWRGEDFQPSRTHHVRALLHRVAAEAGDPSAVRDSRPLVDNTLENHLLRLTPAVVIEMAKQSVAACAKLAGDARYECIKRSLRPDVARAE